MIKVSFLGKFIVKSLGAPSEIFRRSQEVREVIKWLPRKFLEVKKK